MQPEMMKSRKVRLGLLVLLVLVLLVAWIDGGREPQRMIEQPVELSTAAGGSVPGSVR
jgi:hypothetical protein